MKIFQKVFNVISIFIIITLTIGFFTTDFSSYKAKIVNEETRAEKTYIEAMGLKVKQLSQIAKDLQTANDQSKRGEIVPIKLANVYQNSLTSLETLYKDVNAMDVNNKVPDRFKIFHTSFSESVELLGSAVNEIVTYTSDQQESHLTNSDKYFTSFTTKLNDTINLYNKLVFEK